MDIINRPDKLYYHTTLNLGVVANYIWGSDYPWWNKISNYIWLGAIPLKNKGHCEMLQELMGEPISILTILQSYEYTDNSLLTQPVTPQDWKALDVPQKIIHSPDIKPLSQETILTSLKFIEDQIDRKHKVYVHCKAGKGRSATVVICYFIKHCNMTLEQAIKYIKEKRSIININPEQKEAIRQFEFNLRH